MVIALGIVAPEGSGASGSANIKFDLSISDLNEDQEISEPSGAKPFDQLLSQLGGLGLGGLGGAGGAGWRLGLERRRARRGANNENLEKYSKCVAEAGNDVAKARKCAELLTSPRRSGEDAAAARRARRGDGCRDAEHLDRRAAARPLGRLARRPGVGDLDAGRARRRSS